MPRLSHIDSMRGIAAIAVIYTHVAEYALAHNTVSSHLERSAFVLFTDFMDLGKVAVTIFFAISGFVIPFSIFKYRHDALARFGISRFFRLYPAYWLSIPFGLLFVFFYEQHPITPSLVVANMTMLQQFFGVQNILGIYWTLQIEIVFYVLCALLFAVKKLDDVKVVPAVAWLCLLAALGLGLLRHFSGKKLPVALPLALSVMLWGLCIRYFSAERRTQWKRPLVVLTVALIILIPLISILAYNQNMGFHETWYKYANSYYAALVLFWLFYRYVRMTSPVFVYLGRISYSVYLFGPIAEEALLRIFGQRVFALSAHGFLLATIVLTILVAAMIYRFVEAPSIALGKRIGNSFSSPHVSQMSKEIA